MANSAKSSSDISREPVAIIGMACRFPGGVANPEEFWRMILNKTDAISEVPKDRYNYRKFLHPTTNKPGKSYARWGGFLQESVYDFDPLFFGISPREAEAMDPQQRYVLQVAYEALEDAGQPLQNLRGTNTGVFIGGFTLDYKLTQMDAANLPLVDAHTATGSTMSVLSNRVSHAFDLRGPSISVDTACSSSLVAIHLACRSIWSGESDLAVAGGVTIVTRPEYPIVLSNGGFLSKHGRCMAFDERAEGYTRGEGCGIVILKPLSRAVADGDLIYSVIRNTGVNQDGATQGMAAPSGEAQQALMERVYREAGLSPADIHVVEAHGTGTQAGDTTECGALDRAMSTAERQGKAVVGSVKTNIGHLEAAAGVAGLIKASLMVSRGQILPNIHFEKPNPKIPFDQMSIRVPTEPEPWPAQDRVRRAAVNSFGYGGTNAHAVVENHEDERRRPRHHNPDAARLLILPITAQDEIALRRLCARYADRLAEVQTEAELHDLVHSASHRRSFLRHRCCVLGKNRDALCTHLSEFAGGGAPSAVYYDTAAAEASNAPLVYVFTGMGPQWHAMGRELYANEPVFKRFVDRADAIFQRLTGWSILAEMQKPEATSRMDQTIVAQPANFVLQAGLVEILHHYGVRPDIVTGHSVGEVAAAYVSGSLSLEEALWVSHHRSRLQAAQAGTGGMLAAGLSEADASQLVEAFDDVEIAAINSPQSVTLAGDQRQLQALADTLQQREIFHRFLTVEVPYHSARMEPIRQQLQANLRDLNPQSARKVMYSTVTSGKVEGKELGSEYWWRNVRQPVRFSDTIAHIAGEHPNAVFFEVGPHPVLRTSIRESLQHANKPQLQAHTLDRNVPERLAMRKSIARLFALGCEIDWRQVNRLEGNYVRLPSYPWTLQTCRRMSDKMVEFLFGNDGHVYFTEKMECPQPTWEVEVNQHFFPYLQDHQVDDSVVFPGAAYVDAGLAIARDQRSQQRITLEDIRFHRVLIDRESVQTRLQTSHDPASGKFTIHSRLVGQEDSWNLHASGRVIDNATPALEPLALDVTQGHELDVDQFYRDLQRRGLTYGRCFRTVVGLRRTNSTHVVARIQRADIQDDQDIPYVLHPTLLDGVFQSVFALIDAAGGQYSGRPFVPVAIERIHVARPLPDSFNSLASITGASHDEVTGNITLFDDEQRVLARLTGIKCQALAGGDDDENQLDELFYDVKWIKSEPQPIAAADNTSWLLIGNQELTSICASALDMHRLVHRELTDVEASKMAAQVGLTNGLTDVVYLDAFDGTESLDGEAVIDHLDRVRQLVQALIATSSQRMIRLHVLTSRAHDVVAGDCVDNLIGSSLSALGLLIENEHPSVECFFSDVTGVPELQRHVAAILLAKEPIRERAFRGTECFRQVVDRAQLDPLQPQTVQLPVHDRNVAIRLDKSGTTNRLHLKEVALSDPADHEVTIQVEACSMDLQHVLEPFAPVRDSATTDIHGATTLAWEASGVITAIGKGVSEFEVGDDVVGVFSDSPGSYVNVRADHVIKKPQGLRHAEAPILLPYMTAYYGLVAKANLREGEKVLIHNATEAVGLAALQIARWKKAEIFATAGDEVKRQYLRDMGIEHVYSSDNLVFADEIRKDTGGCGVDAVLNTTGGQALSQSVDLLAPFGRFIEAGRKNIGNNDNLPMRVFQENLTFVVIDMDRMLQRRPELCRQLLLDIAPGFENGCFGPLPMKVFPVDRAAEAFQDVACDKPIGRVVLGFKDRIATVTPRVVQNSKIRRDGSYLVTGGTQGFGLEIAKWLAAQGAGQLVLVSRSGVKTDAARHQIAKLRAGGTKVDVRSVDVRSEQEVQQLLETINSRMLPLRGIFHAAVVLEDAFLANVDRESLQRVLRPKMLAATYLHRYSQSMPVDIFFCFSSISALIGHKGQASYVLANAYLDALCQHRRCKGLAATSLNWGAISEVGILSRKTDVAAFFEKAGIRPIRPGEACDVLDRALQRDIIRAGAFRIDWEKWGRNHPVLATPASRFVKLLEAGAQEGDPLEETRRQLIEGCPKESDLENHVLDIVLEQVSSLLKIHSHQLEPGTSIGRLGIDSLGAVELGITIRQSLGVDFSPVKLMSGPSLLDLRDHVVAALAPALAKSPTLPQAGVDQEELDLVLTR